MRRDETNLGVPSQRLDAEWTRYSLRRLREKAPRAVREQVHREIQQASAQARDEKKEIQPMQVLTHVMAFFVGCVVGMTMLALLMAKRGDK
jgi:hypothetical protein